MKFRLLITICLGMALARNAQAHFRLQKPTTRYPIPMTAGGQINENSADLKSPPCGRTGGVRDPKRATTFKPGETIKLQWTETISHPGHYRISFDDNGDNSFSSYPKTRMDIQAKPVLPVLADGLFPHDLAPGMPFETTVTLPDTTCTNCTLQVLEIMAPNPNSPTFYFQCADLILAASAGTDGGSADAKADTAVVTGADTGAAPDVAAQADTGTGGGKVDAASGSPTPDAAAARDLAARVDVSGSTPPASKGSSGGCSAGGQRTSSASALFIAGAAAAAALRARRRQRRSL